MNNIKKAKRTALYGLTKMYPKEDEPTTDFNDSQLFKDKDHISIKLKKIKIYYKEKERLLGMESAFENYLTGEKKQSEYHGGDKNNENNSIQHDEIEVGVNDYIKNFQIEFDEQHEYISYLKISSDKDKEIEFGERKGDLITILNFQGDNMIQCFFGNYDKFGINSLGFYYLDKKSFYFNRIFPMLKLRYKINHSEDFRKKYEKDYKELLKDNIAMIYLYRTCILPDNMFAKIIKYC
jgi:hypothetical protein